MGSALSPIQKTTFFRISTFSVFCFLIDYSLAYRRRGRKIGYMITTINIFGIRSLSKDTFYYKSLFTYLLRNSDILSHNSNITDPYNVLADLEIKR